MAVSAACPTHDLAPEYEKVSLCLKLAGRHFVLEGIPEGWQKTLPSRLLNCAVADSGFQKRVVNVTMSGSERLRPKGETKDLNLASHYFFEADNINYTSDWVEGRFDIDASKPAQLRVHVDSFPWFGGVIENMLRLLVAYDVLNSGGVMLHSAAIVKNDRAVVLFGHSGAGKSTTSALALERGCSVISDDITIIEPVAAGWQVTPVPFSGTLNAVSDIYCPVILTGMYHLLKADRDQVRPCSNARAVSLLAGSSPFVNQDAYRADKMVEVLTQLGTESSVSDLHFTHGPEFLRHVF